MSGKQLMGGMGAVSEQAAARIATLETALRELLVWADWHASRRRGVFMNEPNTGARETARAALAGGGA